MPDCESGMAKLETRAADCYAWAMRRLPALLGAFLLAACAAAQTQPSPTASSNTHTLDIPGSAPWTDTGVDLLAGQTVTITATGTLQFMDGTAPGPQGAARSWKDLLRSMPVNSAGRGALIGRIGSDDAAQPFLVGAQLKITVRAPGRLFLGFNGPAGDSGQGSFHAKVEISGAGMANSSASAAASSATAAAAANPDAGSNLTSSSASDSSATSSATPASPAGGAAPAASSVSEAEAAASLPVDLFTQIPRRIADKDGNVGDMINFLLIGSEDQVKAAFQTAGWVQVDRDTKEAVVDALVASLTKQAYLTMPMSQLYLFGRPQDYGFAHAEPVKVVTTRHHLRVWKSTLTVGGQPVWVGAATHDMGLERDQRNGKLTHHIDPNVDDERGFVERSLSESGYVAKHTHVLPPNPVQDAKTATGGGFHSNGEVLVLWLSSN
jgi:LssY C-terminus